jgi:hypothetical protein
MPKAQLSAEALEAAPWAAHLAASFPVPSDAAKTGNAPGKQATGKHAHSARPRGLTAQELEEDVSRETAALLAARAASSSTTTTSSSAAAAAAAASSLYRSGSGSTGMAPTIPTFFRPKRAASASFLAVELRSAVGRCSLTVPKPVLKAPMVSALDTIIR